MESAAGPLVSMSRLRCPIRTLRRQIRTSAGACVVTGWWDGSQTRGMTDSERTPRPPVGLPLPALITIPTTDTAFHAYVARVRARNLGVTPQQLQAHLRRVFPRVLVR